MNEFINLTLDNIDNEQLCCLIRRNNTNDSVEAKREWLKDRITEGHIYRKLNMKDTVFIEYAPLDSSFVPIVGDNYYYIYCLWVSPKNKGKGYGKALLEYCINDAKRNGKSGICMLGSIKQKAWLSDQSFAKKYNFKVVAETNDGYQLLALSFDNTIPKFSDTVVNKINHKDLTIYYTYQCPYIYNCINKIEEYCKINNISLNLINVNTIKKAKELPCVFNNFGVFYNGIFQTVNLLDVSSIIRIINKGEK